MGEGVFSGVEHPVQHGEDAAGGVGVIDRRTEHEAVRLPGLLNDWVHHIVIEHAAARRLLTGPAGGAIPDGAAAQKEDFRLRAAGFQRISDLPQGCVGAAAGPGAAINQQNFHVYACLPLRYLHDTPPQVPMQAEKWEDFAAGCDSDKKEWAVSL